MSGWLSITVVCNSGEYQKKERSFLKVGCMEYLSMNLWPKAGSERSARLRENQGQFQLGVDCPACHNVCPWLWGPNLRNIKDISCFPFLDSAGGEIKEEFIVLETWVLRISRVVIIRSKTLLSVFYNYLWSFLPKTNLGNVFWKDTRVSWHRTPWIRYENWVGGALEMTHWALVEEGSSHKEEDFWNQKWDSEVALGWNQKV